MLGTLPLAHAGFPSPAGDYLEPPLDLNRLLIARPAATFFMRVVGETTQEPGIQRGDILIVDATSRRWRERSLDPLPNRMAVTIVDGELRVQRMRPGSPVEVWGVVTAGIHFMNERQWT
ncbi:MAG: translesion error-prone DNA polymerase V autoproteolytic subunit [Synechococcales cyanobacterium]